MSTKTLLYALGVGALALAACSEPTEPTAVDSGAGKASAMVTRPYGPDLVISDLTHTPTNPLTEDTLTFVATVRNIGMQAAGASQLEFRIGGESPGAPGTRFAVPALALGQSFSVSRRLLLTVAQNYRNTATADVAGAVEEWNEVNNVRTDDYRVAQADQRNAADSAGSYGGFGPVWQVGLNSMYLAQVVYTGVTGALVQVRLPIYCSYPDQTSALVEIQGVTFVFGARWYFAPNGTVLASATVPGVNLSTERETDVVFPNPPSFVAGDRFAIVLFTTGRGSCGIKYARTGFDYAGGSGLINSRGGRPDSQWSGWQLFPTEPDDLPFLTAVMPR